MPWKLEKAGNGYYVVTISTGRKHSSRPLTYEKAKSQLAALNINTK